MTVHPGLATHEAIARQLADGYNELPSAKPRPLLAIAWDVLGEPMPLPLVLLGIAVVVLYLGHYEGEARALTFTTLVVTNLGLILTNRSWSASAPCMLQTPNPALWWVLSGAVVALGLVLYVPFLRDLFRIVVLHPDDLALCLTAGVCSVLWFEGLKLIWQRQR